ncbi:MAG: TonB family protein [Phaeodactylibacter xiamenensis]|uniref:energy transducer TonB n=1 Tax=Phaeodactylibacter xiamenensis TaxID=1524460 RepID=UPI00069646E3|nr:energy transducer TonB [Phaeodactylibacter xiamenensis]MCR9051969.1 TonB family protein [bacterium]
MLTRLHHIALFLSGLGLTACSSFSSVQSNHPSYSEKYADRIEDGSTHLISNYYTSWEQTLDGVFVFKQYYPSTGVMTDYETYLDRSRETAQGPSKRWYDDGTPWWEGQHFQGQAEGQWRYYYKSNGKLEKTGNYKSGKKEGSWETYNKEGKLASVYHFREGKEDGDFQVYHDNGKLFKEGEYQQGELLWRTTYDSTGQEIDLPEMEEQMPMYMDAACLELEGKERKRCADKQMLGVIYRSIRYPEFAVKRDIEGTVIVRFVIRKNGQVNDIEVLRGLCDPVREEAIRVTQLLNEWQPGQQNGEPVNVQFMLPIRFKLR